MTAPGNVTGGTDTTPMATRVLLIATLTISFVALMMFRLGPTDVHDPRDLAPTLWLFTGLFVLRVAGQVLVALRAPRWLPPMGQWNLLPYRILLPIQLVFIAVMVWLNISFAEGSNPVTESRMALGFFSIGLSAIYAAAMAIRYVVRMRRRTDQRWFGGTIPIVFHFVLASYVYALGSFYAA